MNEPLRILDAGDAALTIEFGSVIDPALLAAVNALDAAIARARRAGALPGVIETMPTFRSPTVFFDPLATERDTLLAALRPLIDAAEHGTPVDGRDEDAPVIECFDGGLHLVAHGGAVKLAVAGDAAVEVEDADGRRALAPWRSVTLVEGEALRIRRMGSGRIAMVAVAGLCAPQVLGSASTYGRAGLGGADGCGRALTAGVRLALAEADASGSDRVLTPPPPADASPIRLVPGPQADHFSAAALQALVGADYRVTAEADRMGIRLEGARLEHAGAAEIVSDATVPGSIQVPGAGQPIVLLADAQTAGGYPKIATVITADLGRLAALRPGQSLHFATVTAAEGARIARAAEAETRALIETLVWSTSANAVASGAIRQTAPKKARPRSKMNFSLRPPASPRPRSARDVFHRRAWRITSPFVRREQFAMGDQTEDRSTRSMASQPYRARLPGFIVDEEIGLGDVLKRVTYRIGIEPCGGCRQRAAALNRWMVFAPPSRKS